MIVIIPDQRKFKSNANRPFDDLITYVTKDDRDITVTHDKNIEGQLTRVSVVDFSDLISYAVGSNEKNTDTEKCIAIRTHGVNDIVTASIEMNAVARKNFRCQDAAYHFILSWPEHEHPAAQKVFDAAEHAIKALGLAEHQYVLAIHGNTDNLHCHVSVNRVHPTTFRSRHLEWAHKTLHLAARQSEIKHGWSHDNGIYVVEVDGHGKKAIVLNKNHAVGASKEAASVHSDLGREATLPAWHDPDSLESWLKTEVSKALKRDFVELTSWHALHAWLDQYDITLTDSGGGGMRLHTLSQETGEILDLAASKGLRLLNRADLEKRWGPFVNSTPIQCIVPDLSNLTPEQIKKGVTQVLTRANDSGKPPDHVLARNSQLGRIPAHLFGSERDCGGDRDIGVSLLPDAISARMGDDKARQDHDRGGHSPGTSPNGDTGQIERPLNRDDRKRAERKEQRAAARADLRLRFSQYKRIDSVGEAEHFERMKTVQKERSLALKQLREEGKTQRSNVKAPKLGVERLLANIQIDADAVREKLKIESNFQERSRSLRENRTPPLSWRAWLVEQSNLGDQAALGALRGIVYQAQRDAKAKDDRAKAEELEEEQADTAEYRERQYRKVMARLLKEEQEEVAIRSANSQVMRPHEIDALLQRYQGMQWQVTGNGNVEYKDLDGGHLFTDRGSRITFDRVRVTDDEIKLALIHAQYKFGQHLTLTGDDPLFAARMARLADDMGIAVLNPELQVVITNHREAKKVEIIQALARGPAAKIPPIDQTKTGATAVTPPMTKPPEPAQQKQEPEPVRVGTPVPTRAELPIKRPPKEAPSRPIPPKPALPIQAAPPAVVPPEVIEAVHEPTKTPQERLRALVLSIDPHATFETADPENSTRQYHGSVAANLDDQTNPGFAQRTARGVYTLHAINAPEHHNDASLEIQYRNGQANVTLPTQGQGKSR